MAEKTVTISTHNGSKAHRQHNMRDERVTAKEPHINPNGVHEVWIDEEPKAAYERIFGEALKEYNENQPREERRIKDYYRHVQADEKKHAVYEMIVGVYEQDGSRAISETEKREILKEFCEGWKKRNPNLEMIGAYYHADEEGEPHVHIDYIPVAHGYSRGLRVQNGLAKALGEQGFYKQGKETAQIQWQRRENDTLAEICRSRGIEVIRLREQREHMNTEFFKEKKNFEAIINNTRELLQVNDELATDIRRLEERKLKLKNKKISTKDYEELEEKLEAVEKENGTLQQQLKNASTIVKGLRQQTAELEGKVKQIEKLEKDRELLKECVRDVAGLTDEAVERVLMRKKSSELNNLSVTEYLHDEMRRSKDENEREFKRQMERSWGYER